jgi:hypothetical protein
LAVASPFASRYGAITWRVAIPLGLTFLVLIPFAFVLVPQWVVDEGKLETGAEEVKAENDARAAALQVLAGLVVATGLGLTARQIQVNREGQVTERFSRSVEQLGHKSPEVRIGAIYALERIANDSQPDRQTVLEVVTAYIREHAKRRSQTTGEQMTAEYSARESLRADVAAALNVIRRWQWGQAEPLDLQKTELPGANLVGAKLTGVNLTQANLYGANLARATLVEAILIAVNLTEANLTGSAEAEVEGYDTVSAEAKPPVDVSAVGPGANLTGAKLSGARLIGANMTGANLTAATLYTADLSGADLTDADLTLTAGALYDDQTRWPDGFDPKAAGAVRVTDHDSPNHSPG